MLVTERNIDKNGVEQIRFKLTVGDCALIISTPRYKDGLFPLDTISRVLFKLSDEDYNRLFEKEFYFDEANGNYRLDLTSEETKQFDSDERYRYEIEYVLKDGCSVTPHSWYFQFLPEING